MARTKRNAYSDAPGVQQAEDEKARLTAQQEAQRADFLRNKAICDEEARQPWHADYVATCRANITKIMSGQLTPQDAATRILSRFPGLSASAQGAWAKLADACPRTAVLRENATAAVQGDPGRVMSTRAYDLAKEIVAEVMAKERNGAS